MDIRYKREMNHNYLIISNTGEIGMESYHLHMLTENHIEGLLRFYVRYVDAEKDYYYEISSKQPLNRILESKKINREEIAALLISISTILKRMETYLLEENQVLLEPEYIYVDPSDFSIYLCYVPGLSKEFREALRSLLQYLLDKTDCQNRENIDLIYHLYQESLKENYRMEDLLNLLVKPEKEQTGLSYEVDLKETVEALNEEFIYGRDEVKERPGFQPISLWLKELFGKKKYKEQQSYSCIGEDKGVYYVEKPLDDMESLGATTLLADYDKGAKKRIVLKSASHSPHEDIYIEKTPFIIGKNKKGVNYTLNVTAVSRFHVRIDGYFPPNAGEGDFPYQKGYRITDLNSTNGTVVNHHLLDANETMELFHGDKVIIAGIEYCFYITNH